MPKYGPDADKGWDNKEFIENFGIKTGFGPFILDTKGQPVKNENGHPMRQWNRCWFDLPEEWIPAVTKLIEDIKAKYVVETIDMAHDDPSIQVWIDQVKCKYGSLRFYFSPVNDEIYDDIDKMIEDCEEQLAEDDPTYGIPY